MPSTVADVIVRTMSKFGVKRIYGIPGDSIDPLVDALRRNKEVQYIQVRHEEGAAFEASVEAELTGNLAACMGTSGPGSIHLLNGLYNAKMQGVPVIALTGQVESSLLGSDYFQEVNLVKLFDDVAVFNMMIANPENAGYIVWRAMREAIIKRGVSHVNLPVDVLRMNAEEYSAEFNFNIGYAPDLAKARDAIDKSKRPLVFIGGGTRRYGELVNAFAEKIGAPIVYALNGKGVISDYDNKVLGGIGLLGTKPSIEGLDKADLIIMLGSSFPYVTFIPENKDIIQVDVNPQNLGKRIDVKYPIVSDVGQFLTNITPMLKEKEDKFYLEMKGSKERWLEELSKLENANSEPIKPQRVAFELSRRFESGVVIVDTGNVTMWGSRNFKANGKQKFVFSSWLGSMGVGIPGSAAASSLGERSLALVGDGGFIMTSSELITAKKYNLPIKVVIFNNSKLGMIKFEQEVMGYPEWGVDLYNPDFSKFAESIGIHGYHVEKPSELEKTIEQFLGDEAPAVLDVVVDPNERPMPPKLNFTQAKNYVISIFKEKLEPVE
ncbi:pyruvate oxidase [Sulfolobales archaeon HS-7]|nr:pyruvate oxidase [Sulfolobales archaeon HS-7]